MTRNFRSQNVATSLNEKVPLKSYFQCKHTSSFKMIIDLGDLSANAWSLDTGISENIMSEFYFNMQAQSIKYWNDPPQNPIAKSNLSRSGSKDTNKYLFPLT